MRAERDPVTGTDLDDELVQRLLRRPENHSPQAAGRSYLRIGLVPSSGSSDDPGFPIRVGPLWWRSG